MEDEMSIKKALVFCAVFGLVYLGSAFVAWEINPGDWSDFGRFTTVLIGGAIGAAVASWD
jgi:hypothetical protein